MAELVYILCTAASMACAFLLFRGYRAQHSRLLLLSTLCFLGLAINSVQPPYRNWRTDSIISTPR